MTLFPPHFSGHYLYRQRNKSGGEKYFDVLVFLIGPDIFDVPVLSSDSAPVAMGAIESQQAALYQQLESVKSLGCTTDALTEAVQSDLREIVGQEKWI